MSAAMVEGHGGEAPHLQAASSIGYEFLPMLYRKRQQTRSPTQIISHGITGDL
jgi:hypothetical protein